VDEFKDRDDFLLALMASCFIPFYLEKNAWIRWRNGMYVDGGFVELVPLIPNYAMSIVFGAKSIGPILPTHVRRSKDLISPSSIQDFPYTLPDLIRRSLVPASEKEMSNLFEWGERAGNAWAEQSHSQQ
jgi:predicted acylesterase/phospholipase RssA